MSMLSGCLVVRSCGSTPQIASTRRSVRRMRSAVDTALGHGDQLATGRAHLPLEQLLDHRGRARALDDEAGVDQVATEHTEHPVTELVAVEDDLVAGGELGLDVVPDR